MLQVGIIGAGLVFQGAHARAYEQRNDVRVAAVADPVESYRTQVGGRLHCDRLFEDYRQVLDIPEVQAVDVCLPHSMHEEAVLAAFQAGKDVVLEKPIALDLEEADRMIVAAEDAGRQFHVALNQRFYPAHRKVKAILDAGEYGAPFFAVAHAFGNEFERMNDPGNWKGSWDKAGGGALADTGTHLIDLMLWWFGRPKKVSCQWGRFMVEPEHKGDDNIVVTLGYDGMLAEVAVSYTTLSDPWRESKWIYTREASLQLHFDPEQPILIGKNGKAPEPLGEAAQPNWWDSSVQAGVNHWLDCFQGLAAPDFGPEAAREALEIVLLAYRAAEENRTLDVPGRHEEGDSR